MDLGQNLLPLLVLARLALLRALLELPDSVAEAAFVSETLYKFDAEPVQILYGLPRNGRQIRGRDQFHPAHPAHGWTSKSNLQKLLRNRRAMMPSAKQCPARSWTQHNPRKCPPSVFLVPWWTCCLHMALDFVSLGTGSGSVGSVGCCWWQLHLK